MTAERPDCREAPRITDRIVADRVTAADRVHAAGCATCGPILARADRFDEELRRASRRLVTDELPPGLLDRELFPKIVDVAPSSRGAPGLLGLLAGVVILITATSVALREAPLGLPTHDPSATPPIASLSATPRPSSLVTSPPFVASALRSAAQLGGDLIGLGYLCQSGREREDVDPAAIVVRDAIVCYSPKSLTLTSVVISVGETRRNRVAQVTIHGQLVGQDTEEARNQLAETMAKATFLVIDDPDTAPTAGDFVLAQVPGLRSGEAGSTAYATFGELRLTLLRRADGSYDLTLDDPRVS